MFKKKIRKVTTGSSKNKKFNNNVSNKGMTSSRPTKIDCLHYKTLHGLMVIN